MSKRKHNKMATRIAITPILHGKEAKKVLRESKRLPTKKSRQGLENLNKMFNGKVKNK